MRTSLLACAALFAIDAAGCAQTAPAQKTEAIRVEEQPQPPPASAAFAPTPPSPAPAPAPAPAAAPAGGQAQPLAPAAAAAATAVLMPLGQSEAPDAHPEGSAFAGSFQEGQTLVQPFNLEPGRCYTVVAAAMGVQQTDVLLVVQPGPMFPPAVLANSTGGPTTVVGGKAAGCVKSPLPIGSPAQIVLRATRGAGMIAAQLYSK